MYRRIIPQHIFTPVSHLASQSLLFPGKRTEANTEEALSVSKLQANIHVSLLLHSFNLESPFKHRTQSTVIKLAKEVNIYLELEIKSRHITGLKKLANHQHGKIKKKKETSYFINCLTPLKYFFFLTLWLPPYYRSLFLKYFLKKIENNLVFPLL